MNASAKPQLTIDAFENSEIDADAFNHDAHVYMAWLYVNRYSLADALQRFTAALRRLTRKLGVPGKYHATITWFYLLLINERREKGATRDWYTFRRLNADLFATGSDNIISRHYRKETLASNLARTTFVMPDRLAG